MFVLLSRIAHRPQHSHWNPQPNSFRKVFVTPQSHQLTACGDTEYLCDFCLCTVRSYTLLALARSCAQGLLDKSIPQEGEPPLKRCTFLYRLTRHHPLPNTVRQLFAPYVYKQRLQANTKLSELWSNLVFANMIRRHSRKTEGVNLIWTVS